MTVVRNNGYYLYCNILRDISAVTPIRWADIKILEQYLDCLLVVLGAAYLPLKVSHAPDDRFFSSSGAIEYPRIPLNCPLLSIVLLMMNAVVLDHKVKSKELAATS